MILPAHIRSLVVLGVALGLYVMAQGPALAQAPQAGESCGEPQEVTGRPRIGLALAGGGGKGWAHIGVLKVLEELRVPIDCIAGTSAGSIVGGIYASGTSVAEMEEVIVGSDWGRLFQDRPPRKDEAFGRKIQDLRGLWALELGVGKGGVKLPSGIFAGQEVNALLRRLTLRAVGTESFDELEIPFRAVATDLKTGELVVLDRGELATAMRASMAVPGAFTPEPVGGRLLVDGGLRQNLPVETVRAMGADVVIAVDLGEVEPTEAQLANPLGVANQMISIFINLNVRASRQALASSDVLVEPQVQKFSSGDFSRGAELIPIGATAARKVVDGLRALSLSEQQYASFRDRQRTRAQAAPAVAKIEIDTSGLRYVNPEYVRERFADDATGVPDQRRIQTEIAALLGDGDYERIDYRYEDRDGGASALVIAPREKPWGPGYLRLGLRLATDFKEDTGFDLLGSYQRHWVNSRGGQVRAEFSLGTTTGLRTELYQPVMVGKGLFLAPSLAVRQRSANLFIGDLAFARYRVQELGGALDVGWTFGRYAEFRVGLERGVFQYDPSIAVPIAPAANVQAGGVRAGLVVDRLDSVSFPREGYFFSTLYRNSLRALGADEQYQKGSLGAVTALSTGRHTLQLQLRGGGAIDGELPIYDLVTLGGLFNLSGYQNNQLQGETFALGRAAYYYRLTNVPVLLKGLYAGISLEAGQVYERLDGASATGLLPAAAIFIGADSALGPFYLAYGHAFRDNLDTIYFYLGTFY